MTFFGLYIGIFQAIMLSVSIMACVRGVSQYIAEPNKNIRVLDLTDHEGNRVSREIVGIAGIIICAFVFGLVYMFTPFFNVFGPYQFLYVSLFLLMTFNDLERGYVSARPDVQIPKVIFFYFLLYAGGFFAPNV